MATAGGHGPTRRQILAELCGGRRTANEIARDFGISGTAVRDHLKGLSEEGLVLHTVERRGVGKPTHVYELTADGHALLSKAYVPVMGAILEAAANRHGAKILEELLSEAGRSLAVGAEAAAGPLRKRAEIAAAALEQLGARLTVAKQGRGYTLQGRCCPLAPLTSDVPALCGMIESMLRELTGAEVREECDRGIPPRCRFAFNEAG